MKNKTHASKITTPPYDQLSIFPTFSVDLGDAEKYRSAIEQIRSALDEDRTSGKLLALKVYNSQYNESTATFFMHKQDAYIVGFTDRNAINQFPSDDQLRYPGQTSFSLYNIQPHFKTIHMLGFAIAEAVRFAPIAKYIEFLIEKRNSFFDITTPIQNKKGKIWYLEEHRGSGTINTMTALTMKKLKTSWKATDVFNKYHLKEPITDHSSTPATILKTIVNECKSIVKKISLSTELIESLQRNLKMDTSSIQDDLSTSTAHFTQQDYIKLIRKFINSYLETISRCQNDLQNLAAMHEETTANYINIQEKIKRREEQNKKVPKKLLKSKESKENFLNDIEKAIKLTETQMSMGQQLFDLTKVAHHTELAVPYPFHPEPKGREAVVSLNTTDNLLTIATEESLPKKHSGKGKHKVSSRSSGNDDPDNDQDREAIIENKPDTNEHTSYYNLVDYYLGWIYQLPKWLQDNLLNSEPINKFIETLKYHSRFIDIPKTLEKDLSFNVLEKQEYEYEDNINQTAQINYNDDFHHFELNTMGSIAVIGIILPIFIEQKDPLLGLGNNFIEI